MMFDRPLWENVPLNSICVIKRGNIITKNEIREGNIPVIASAVGVTYYHDTANIFDEVITVSSSGVNAGFVNFHTTPIYASDCITIQTSTKRAHLTFIFLYLKFSQKRIMSFQRGTAQPHVYPKDLNDFSIPLPTLEEQQRIVDLLQSIEVSISLVDNQGMYLKKLWLGLVNQLVTKIPKFGDLLENTTLQTYKFKDIVYKKNKKIDPISSGIERIVAGENLESEDFKIRSWGVVSQQYLGPAFHMQFDKGDILYGSRRTYLKKVAFAEFSGVCANTTYVIRANEKCLLQDLLKHIMLSDQFTKYSIGVSKGSTNPYINWKDLDNYEFNLPDIMTQRSIANVLDEVVLIIEMLKDQKMQLQQLKQKLLNSIFA